MSQALPSELPLFPLGTVLFPGAPLPLRIFEPRYRRMMRDYAGRDPIFGVVLTRSGSEVADTPEIHPIGTAAGVLEIRQHADGRFDLTVVGGRRFRVVAEDWSREYLVGQVEWLDESGDEAEALPALRDEGIALFTEFVALVALVVQAEIPEELLPEEPLEAGYAIANRMPINTWERQALLEIEGTAARLRALAAIIRREITLLRETGAAGAVLEQPGMRFFLN